MQINYTEDAFSALLQLVNFIESENTKGSGLRWLGKFESFYKASSIHLNKLSFAIIFLLAAWIFAAFIIMIG